MKDKKRLLLLIGIIILVLIIILLIVTSVLKSRVTDKVNGINTNSSTSVNELDGKDTDVANYEEIENVINDANYESMGISLEETKKVYTMDLSGLYFDALGCVELYNSRLEKIYDDTHNINQDGNASDIVFTTAAVECLDKLYVSNNGITETNINQLAGHYTFIPTSAYRNLQLNQNVVLFGYRIDTINNRQEEYGYIVQINESDKVFSIIPYEYMKINGITHMQEGNVLNIVNEKVEEKDYNHYSRANFNALKVGSEYLKLFKKTVSTKPEIAYEKLTDDYKSKFGSAEKFRQYINNNYDKFSSIYVSSATEKAEGNFITYTCVDLNGNKFYIKANSKNAVEYSIELANIAL